MSIQYPSCLPLLKSETNDVKMSYEPSILYFTLRYKFCTALPVKIIMVARGLSLIYYNLDTTERQRSKNWMGYVQHPYMNLLLDTATFKISRGREKTKNEARTRCPHRHFSGLIFPEKNTYLIFPVCLSFKWNGRLQIY